MQHVCGRCRGYYGEVNDRQATIDPFFLRNEPYCPRVIRSAYDAVDGSRHPSPGRCVGPGASGGVDEVSTASELPVYAKEAFSSVAGPDEHQIVIQKPIKKAVLANALRSVLDDGNPRT